MFFVFQTSCIHDLMNPNGIARLLVTSCILESHYVYVCRLASSDDDDDDGRVRGLTDWRSREVRRLLWKQRSYGPAAPVAARRTRMDARAKRTHPIFHPRHTETTAAKEWQSRPVFFSEFHGLSLQPWMRVRVRPSLRDWPLLLSGKVELINKIYLYMTKISLETKRHIFSQVFSRYVFFPRTAISHWFCLHRRCSRTSLRLSAASELQVVAWLCVV